MRWADRAIHWSASRVPAAVESAAIRGRTGRRRPPGRGDVGYRDLGDTVRHGAQAQRVTMAGAGSGSWSTGSTMQGGSRERRAHHRPGRLQPDLPVGAARGWREPTSSRGTGSRALRTVRDGAELTTGPAWCWRSAAALDRCAGPDALRGDWDLAEQVAAARRRRRPGLRDHARAPPVSPEPRSRRPGPTTGRWCAALTPLTSRGQAAASTNRVRGRGPTSTPTRS